MKYFSILMLLLLTGVGCDSIPSTKNTVTDTTTSTAMVDTTTTTTVATSTEPTSDDDSAAVVVVTSFDECVAAGNPVMESQPRQCKHTDGTLYVETIKPTPQPASVAAGISISGKVGDSGVALNWTVNSINVDKGFKIVYATTPNPTFGKDAAVYIENSSTRSYTVPLKDGKTYYFRVCRYTGDGCENYSNTLTLTTIAKAVSHDTNKVKETVKETTNKQTSSVTGISLSAGGSNTINWKTSGDASMGFKVVYSTYPNPTYPQRNNDDNAMYVSDPQTTYGKLYANQGSGTYYVRVCEYTGNGCGVYSNEISIELSK